MSEISANKLQAMSRPAVNVWVMRLFAATLVALLFAILLGGPDGDMGTIFVGIPLGALFLGMYLKICYENFTTYRPSHLTIFTTLILAVLTIMSLKFTDLGIVGKTEFSYILESLHQFDFGSVRQLFYVKMLFVNLLYFLAASMFIGSISRNKGGIAIIHAIFIIALAFLFFPVNFVQLFNLVF